MRLNQYLAACGLGSRRRCEELISGGRVRVNGERPHFGVRVREVDRVEVDGRPVHLEKPGAVWVLNKPRGVLTSATDPLGRPTVLDLARERGIQARVFPVGRLDFETTGLLLLTSDGDLAHRLTHPSWGIEKEYEASVEQPLSEASLQRLRDGPELEDGPTAPCAATQDAAGERWVVGLVLHEGRKRQVRRMLAALGHPVLELHRTRLGPLRLGDLGPGEIRPLGDAERAALEAELARAGPAAARRAAPRPGAP